MTSLFINLQEYANEIFAILDYLIYISLRHKKFTLEFIIKILGLLSRYKLGEG